MACTLDLKRLVLLSVAFLPGLMAVADEPSVRRPNVLFIAVDDLRPQLKCYGREFMRTPNFDALAERSVLFEKAYCMVPTCGASRASLMTGLRPNPKRFVSYTARADKEAPGAITLNTHFKANGYETHSLGKVFHSAADSAAGWSQEPWRSKGNDYSSARRVQQAIKSHRASFPKSKREMRGPAFEYGTHGEENYRDHQTASEAIKRLMKFSKQPKQPFFLAVGFVKPHLPFCAPKKYWDLYDFDQIDVPSNFALPTGVPSDAAHTSGELRSYSGIPPKGPVDRETARHLIHGYYACVSFIDAEVGRLLQVLERQGLSDNTIIVLWGDHGWQLGEHGMWNKHSCFETSMHAPLLVSAPGIQGGTRTTALTEFIDIYPTLCELAGIETPTHVQGTSFVPQLRDPSVPGKPYAVGRFKSGDTIRSESFRFSEYRGNRGIGDASGSMLYDHQSDPDENQNIVDAEHQASTVSLLRRELNERKGKPASSFERQ